MKKLDFILHLKSWELFLIILAGGFLKECKFEDLPLLTAILTSIGMVVMCGWAVFVGHRLCHYFPGLSRMNYTLYTFCSIFWILATVLLPVVSSFTRLPFVEIVTIPGAIFIFLTGLYCTFFTARMLESVEAGKEVTAWESLGSLLLLVILPIGIWFFQPIIRKSFESRLHEPSIQQ